MASDSDTMASLRHWAHYGQRGSPPTRRVKGSDRDHLQLFKKPKTASWNARISAAEIPTILNGFQPQMMEDKWFVYADGPNAQGIAIVHMYRSWTGKKMFELKIDVRSGGGSGIKRQSGGLVTDIKWESDTETSSGLDEKEAKEIATGVCTWVMNVKVETP